MEMIGLEPRFVAKPASGTVGFAFSSHLLGVPSVVGSSKVKQKDRRMAVLMEMIGLEPRFVAKPASEAVGFAFSSHLLGASSVVGSSD